MPSTHHRNPSQAQPIPERWACLVCRTSPDVHLPASCLAGTVGWGHFRYAAADENVEKQDGSHAADCIIIHRNHTRTHHQCNCDTGPEHCYNRAHLPPDLIQAITERKPRNVARRDWWKSIFNTIVGPGYHGLMLRPYMPSMMDMRAIVGRPSTDMIRLYNYLQAERRAAAQWPASTPEAHAIDDIWYAASMLGPAAVDPSAAPVVAAGSEMEMFRHFIRCYDNSAAYF